MNIPGLGEVVLKTSYSVAEVVNLLGFGKSTVYDAIERGEVPSIRMGGAVRVPGYYVNSRIAPAA